VKGLSVVNGKAGGSVSTKLQVVLKKSPGFLHLSGRYLIKTIYPFEDTAPEKVPWRLSLVKTQPH
jgi:hypothetical protein